jgi:hypothetical protein
VYKLAESVRALYPAVQDDYLFGLEVCLVNVFGHESGPADVQAAVKALDPDYNQDLPQ